VQQPYLTFNTLLEVRFALGRGRRRQRRRQICLSLLKKKIREKGKTHGNKKRNNAICRDPPERKRGI
jgi:hypothetical protein